MSPSIKFIDSLFPLLSYFRFLHISQNFLIKACMKIELKTIQLQSHNLKGPLGNFIFWVSIYALQHLSSIEIDFSKTSVLKFINVKAQLFNVYHIGVFIFKIINVVSIISFQIPSKYLQFNVTNLWSELIVRKEETNILSESTLSFALYLALVQVSSKCMQLFNF